MNMWIVPTYITLCAVCDARTLRVPNRLTLPALALAALYRATCGTLWFPALVGTAFLYWIWRSRLFYGGGDAKVLMALWLAWPDPALALVLCLTLPLYYLFHRLAFRQSQFPALIPTALGVWVYAFSTALLLRLP